VDSVAVPTGQVLFYSDIGCPWASLAVFRLRRRRAALGLDDAVVVDHRCFPLELINERLTPKNILDSELVVVAGREPALGWRPWGRAESAYPGSTLLPMAAVQAAKAEPVGGLRASEELDAALRQAWYAGERSVHLYAEILRVADGCSAVDGEALDAELREGAGFAAVFRQWQEALAIGVQGSPHLYLPDGFHVHNPGVGVEWTGGNYQGVPVIVEDQPAIYDDLLRRAVGDG
jgi:predicted DsbA family dithiol-disulfide isomerase